MNDMISIHNDRLAVTEETRELHDRSIEIGDKAEDNQDRVAETEALWLRNNKDCKTHYRGEGFLSCTRN